MSPGVLWRCATALVVDKPSGVLTHNSAYSGPREASLRQAVGAAEGRRVYPVHRLDRGTSGGVLFATERAHVAAWQRTLSEPTTVKVYVAIVRGTVSARIEVDRPIRGASGVARPARSVVVPLATAKAARCAVIAVGVATGRLHQIRRHCDAIGHPVVNDATHGDSRFNRAVRDVVSTPRLMLHAASLGFLHEGATVEVAAPVDGAFVAALARLGAPGALDELTAARVEIAAWRARLGQEEPEDAE